MITAKDMSEKTTYILGECKIEVILTYYDVSDSTLRILVNKKVIDEWNTTYTTAHDEYCKITSILENLTKTLKQHRIDGEV